MSTTNIHQIADTWKKLTTQNKRALVLHVADTFQLQPYYVRDTYFIRKKIPITRIDSIYHTMQNILKNQQKN